MKLGNFECIGIIPENAVLVPRDDQNLTQDTEISLVPFDTSAKCEYICKLKDFVYDLDTKKCKPNNPNSGVHAKKCVPNRIVPSNLTRNCQRETSEFNCLKYGGRDGIEQYDGALGQGGNLGIEFNGARLFMIYYPKFSRQTKMKSRDLYLMRRSGLLPSGIYVSLGVDISSYFPLLLLQT